MGRDDVLRVLLERSFQPFRMHLSTGIVYEIRHPDLIYVGRSALLVGVPPVGQSGVFGKQDTLALLHLVRFEPIEIPASPGIVPSRN